MRRIAVAQRRSTTPDGVLAQEAAAGSGASYAALYDRYETRVFNYSLRLLESPEDAADATQEAFLNVLRRLQDDERPVLDFSSYLFAAARHESYALMRRGARIRPTEIPPEEPGRPIDIEADPERAVLFQDSQETVRAANAQLPPRYREVLALREVGERSYDEIGRIMGISGNAAAQLIWRARGKLRELLTAGAVASVVATSSDCERAQLLITRRQDGELVEESEVAWLDAHMDACRSCRTAEAMLLEVATSYRAWLPVAALAGMRMDAIARAGELVGADWSGAASTGQAGGSGSGAAGAGAAVATLAALGVALWLLLQEDPKLEQRAAPASPPPPATAARPPPERDARVPRQRVAKIAAARGPVVVPAVASPQPATPAAEPVTAAPRPAHGVLRAVKPPPQPDSPRQLDPPRVETPPPPVPPPAPVVEPPAPPDPPAEPPPPPEPPAKPPPPPEPPGCGGQPPP